MIILGHEEYLCIFQDDLDISCVVDDTFKEHNGSVPLKVFKQSLIKRLSFDPSEVIEKEKLIELETQGNLGGTTFFYPIKENIVLSSGFYTI